ncbi:MAG: energy transducer TonB [Bacteroidales bacterium]|nr:energy transducer TonB [Bacteroidales bacterium]
MKKLSVKLTAFSLMLLCIVSLQAQGNKKTNDKSTNKNITADKVYESCEQSAEFPGGFDTMLNFISSTLEYPPQSIENKIEGRVVVKFIIETDGSISNVEILKGLDEYCNQETLRIIKAMPRWKPAEEKGKKVRQQFVIPIRFKLT